MTGYYDLILGLIPLALLGITGALSMAGVSLTAAVPVGATVSVGLMGHAMFVRAPVDAEAGPEPEPEPTAVQPSD